MDRKIINSDITKELQKNCEIHKMEICNWIRNTVRGQLKKEGIVIGISGGIDSAVVAALAAEGLGPERVFGLILPEKESSPMSRELAEDLCTSLKIPYKEISITPVLNTIGIYSEMEAAIKQIFPHYRSLIHTISLSRPSLLSDENMLNIPSLELIRDNEKISSKKLSSSQFFHLLSLQNVKQRTRMIMEYMYAEKMNYAVCGTTNKTELLLGFFVKYGDSGVDLEPIANLYKSQVYGIAELYELDTRIIARKPSPDTWSHNTSDEEMALRLPYNILDSILYAQENCISLETLQHYIKLNRTQIKSAIKHVDSLRSAARLIQPSPLMYG